MYPEKALSFNLNITLKRLQLIHSHNYRFFVNSLPLETQYPYYIIEYICLNRPIYRCL